jgi:hypothetical protein
LVALRPQHLLPRAAHLPAAGVSLRQHLPLPRPLPPRPTILELPSRVTIPPRKWRQNCARMAFLKARLRTLLTNTGQN